MAESLCWHLSETQNIQSFPSEQHGDSLGSFKTSQSRI